MSERDPGLQPERTALSWRRSAWSMLVPALLCLRGWGIYGHWAYILSGGLLLAGTLTIFCNTRFNKHIAVSLIVIISGVLLMFVTVKRYALGMV